MEKIELQMSPGGQTKVLFLDCPSDELSLAKQQPPADDVEAPVSRNTTEDDDSSNYDESSSTTGSAKKKQEPSCHPRLVQLYTTADWWSLWIGLLTFGFGLLVVFLNSDDYSVPQPEPWQNNPLDAWNVYNLVGVPILVLVLGSLYLVSLQCMGKLKGNVRPYIVGFVVMAFLATIAFWVGRNDWCSRHGLGYAVWSIVIGMTITNVHEIPMLEKAAKDGEFFIKCSLGLLAVQLNVLVDVGGPGMIVAWIGSPIAVIVGYLVGTRLFHCPNASALLISVGACWCGASAMSAVAPILHVPSEDLSLSISVVAFFTILFTFAQPYLAIYTGIPDDVAGAWIGGSVDQTGNVVVSAAIISDEATEVAGIVKMVLNASLGVMASVVACFWSSRSEESSEKGFKLIMLWDKFPKFTLGFIITSAVLTVLMENVEDEETRKALPRAISTLNRWWFAIAFVGIGLTTNVRKLWEKAITSGIVQVYLFANTIDILLALGLAYLAYYPF